MPSSLRVATLCLLVSLPAGATQVTLQPTGTTGTSYGPRFGVAGAVDVVGQAASSSQRFSVTASLPTDRDPIFSSGFE